MIDLHKSNQSMTSILETDLAWMRYALRLAQKAETQNEVPVGALLVLNERCIATGWNTPIMSHDPSAHAEINVLRQAGKQLQNYRLVGTTLYVTLEPCLMCLGAITQARVDRVVFGAVDEKRGAICSALKLSDTEFLNHKIEWTKGVLEKECAELLTSFFKARR